MNIEKLRKEMASYEAKLFNGGVHCHEKYLKYTAARTCKAVMVLSSRRKYSNLRELADFNEIKDWSYTPAQTSVDLL